MVSDRDDTDRDDAAAQDVETDRPDADDQDSTDAESEATPDEEVTESDETTVEDEHGEEVEGIDEEVTDDEQTWAILVHASAFAGLVVPFGNVFGPLLVWLIKKDESRFVDENGKEALNFQITWTALMLVALLTLLVGVGFLLVPIVAVAWVVLVVMATIRASEKTVYDYPLTIDLIE